MTLISWMLLAVVCLPIVVGAWWCCCALTSNCTTVLDGYCFTFKLSGVAAAPGTLGDAALCPSCPDFNETWLLVPASPISSADQSGCIWRTCRPPVCCGYHYPLSGPNYRFTMTNDDSKKGGTTDWTITSGCEEVVYHLGSPNLSTGTNTFKLLTYNPAYCQYWPQTITVTGVPPTARGSQTRTAQSFATAPIYPIQNSPSPWVIAPGVLYNNNPLVTEWLLCYNFGFTVPANAWVTGLSVQFKRWADQPTAVTDNAVTVWNISFIETTALGELENLYAQPGWWPLFSGLPNADIATYGGGQYDQMGLDEIAVPATLLNTSYLCVGISSNNTRMTFGASHVDPTSVRITAYYVTVPCQDNCCACPPLSGTGLPPRAYSVTFPYIPTNCNSGDFPNPLMPECDCDFIAGQTFEMPYSSLLSIPTYTCVYTLTYKYWTFTLTISNIGPDARQFEFTAGTQGSGPCASPAGVTAGGFFQGVVQASGPNLAISQCGSATFPAVADAFNCFCDLAIHIGGPPGPPLSLTVSPIT